MTLPRSRVPRAALAVAAASFALSCEPAPTSSFPTSQGWSSPTASAFERWDVDICTPVAGSAGAAGLPHLGADALDATPGAAVHAIADGIVVRVDGGWPGEAVGVVHRTSGGEAFLAVYGHLADATTSATVSKDDVLGVVDEHVGRLHLGVRPLQASEAAAWIDGASPALAVRSDIPDDALGYVDPLAWLAARAPAGHAGVITFGAASGPPGAQLVAAQIVGPTPPTPPPAPSCTVDDLGGVTVAWTDATDNGSPITDYEVRYDNVDAATVSGWTGTGTGLSWTKAGLSLGVHYLFSVRAVNDVGPGAASDWSTACVPRTAPGKPSGVAAMQSGANILVSWMAASANGDPISDYEVEWQGDHGAGTGSLSAGPSTSTTFAVPVQLASYSFRVQAGNDAGWGAFSDWTASLQMVPPPSLVIADGSGFEGDTGDATLTLDVTLSQAATTTVTVDWHTEDGTAIAPGDYVAASGTLTFAPGVTTQQVAVQAVGDVSNEQDETFSVVLTNPVGAVVGGTGSGTATILDDDMMPHITTTVGEVVEGNLGQTPTLTIPVLLSAPSSRTVTVDWTTVSYQATVDDDFVGASGTVTFAPGQTQGQIDLTVVGDYNPEPDEWVRVDLTNPVNAELFGFFSSAFGIIQDDGDTGATVPDPPTGVAVSSGGNGYVPVSWTAPVYTGFLPIDSYDVQLDGTSTMHASTSSPYSWTGLSNGTAYRFEVRACNAVGCSAWSAVSGSATPYTVPGAPGAPGVTSVNNGVYVTWGTPGNGGNGINHYDVDYSSGTANVGNTNNWTPGFGQDGSWRSFRVRACNSAGCSGWSGSSASVRPKVIQVNKGSQYTSNCTNCFWYDTYVYGPPNWSLTVHCNDGGSSNWYSRSATLNGDGVWHNSQLCYDGYGGPHTVSGDGGLGSNNAW